MSKRILIINSSAFTIGDAAISNCMVEQILQVNPGSKITIESGNATIHKKYISNSGINIVQRLFDTRNIVYSSPYFSLPFIINNLNIIFQYLFDAIELFIFYLTRKSFTQRKIFDAMNNSDIIISAGGDAITKNYGFFLRLYILILLKKMNKQIIIYASTIGPFSGISKYMTIRCLQKLDLILVRDRKSYNFLRKNGLNSNIVKQTADCVILLDKKSTPKTKQTIRDFLITKSTIGIFLKANAFSNVLKKNYLKYLEKINGIITELYKFKYKIIFFSANNTDYIVSKNFIEHYKLNNKIINLMNFQPNEAKELLSKTGLIITSRMHPAILASTANVPVIGISDESKMQEYFKIINFPDFFIKQSNFSVSKIVNLSTKIIRNNGINNKINKFLIYARDLANKNITYYRKWNTYESHY